MRNAVLFIISAFVFSGCVTTKQFNSFANELKSAKVQNEATAMNHLRLTKEMAEETATLKKRLGQTELFLAFTMFNLSQLDQATAKTFAVLIKALEYKGIKLDLKATWQRMQKEEMEKKLKEKVE